MREYQIRMTVRTNEDDAPGADTYFGDQEMPQRLAEWFASALYGQDDQPYILWSEITLRGTTDNHEHRFQLPVSDEDTCSAFLGCPVTWRSERLRLLGLHEVMRRTGT